MGDFEKIKEYIGCSWGENLCCNSFDRGQTCDDDSNQLGDLTDLC